MMYNRESAVAYAHTWAYKRNARYYNFDELGGDCTNFVSQCLLAGSDGVMDYTPDIGWYYKNINNRAPAWTGVEFLYRYLVDPNREGPRATVLPLAHTQVGDIIQLSFDGEHYTHSLLVVRVAGVTVATGVTEATGVTGAGSGVGADVNVNVNADVNVDVNTNATAVTDSNIFVATHSDDADNRILRSYPFRQCRLLHVTEVIK